LPYTFAADSRTVAIAGYHPDGGPGLLLTSVDDGVPSRWLDLSRVAVPITSVREPAFRPTDPNTLLVTGDRSGDAGPIVFTVDVTSGDIQTVVQTTGFVGLDSARWSPDGQSISYTTWSNETMGLSVRTHLIGPDGTGDRLLPAPPEMVFDIGAAWSNDSTRLLLIRGFTSGWEDTRAAIVPADGSGLGVDIPYEGPIQGGCCYVWEWAPDDTKVLGKLIEPTGVPGRHVIVDVASATVSQAPWASTDDPSWQRRAP
jgi:dipeptidyl aminopeptidase/acylaminoacyl peptidase